MMMTALWSPPGGYIPNPAAELPISGAGGTWKCFRTAKMLLVPVRYVPDKFGGELIWDDSTFVATVQLDGHSYRFQWGGITAVVDGQAARLETKPLIDPRESRMYISADDLYKITGIGAAIVNGEVVIDRGVQPEVDRTWSFSSSSWLFALAASAAAFFFFKGRV